MKRFVSLVLSVCFLFSINTVSYGKLEIIERYIRYRVESTFVSKKTSARNSKIH